MQQYVGIPILIVFIFICLVLVYVSQNIRSYRISKLAKELGLNFIPNTDNFKFFFKNFIPLGSDFIRNKAEGDLYGHKIQLFDSYQVRTAYKGTTYNKSTHLVIDSSERVFGNSFTNTLPSIPVIQDLLLKIKDEPATTIKSYDQLKLNV